MAQAQKITPPCEVGGQFYPAGDLDTFAFDAKKGDAWWIEVVSNRLGLSTNPFVLVVHHNIPVNPLGEFVDYVRKCPNELSYVVATFGGLGCFFSSSGAVKRWPSKAISVMRTAVKSCRCPRSFLYCFLRL